MKMPNLKSFKEIKNNKIDVKKLRKKESINKSKFLNIGRKSFLNFPDMFEKKIYNKGRFKHPSNVKLITLK